MKKQEPIIIWFDQPKINQMNEAIEEALPLIHLVVNEYKKVPYYDPKTDLATLIQNQENIKHTYKLKLVQELHPVLEGSVLELDAAEEAKKWKIPTPQLDRAITQVNDMFLSSVVNMNFFELKNGKVIVREEMVRKFADRYTIKATTEQEIKTVKSFESFIRAITKLDSLLRENRSDLMFLNQLHPIQISRYLLWDGEKYSINPHVFRRMQKQMALLDPME